MNHKRYTSGGIVGYLSGKATDCINKVLINSKSTVSTSTYEDSKLFLGGIAGYSTGSIKNSINAGKINEYPEPINDSQLFGYIGGIAGWSENGNICNCTNSESIILNDKVRYGENRNSIYYVAGIVGYSTSVIEDCSNEESVRVERSNGYNDAERYVGGIAAYSNGIISNCYNGAVITSVGRNSYVGGIVAYNTANITNCSNTGNLSSSYVSKNSSSSFVYAYVAGIAGNSTGAISLSYNIGTICWDGIGASNYVYAAGIAGYAKGDVVNCYNIGTVQGDMYYGNSGGIVGKSLGAIVSCYDVGCFGMVSGIVGDSEQLMQNCYYLNYASNGSLRRDIAVACSMEEMKEQAHIPDLIFQAFGKWEKMLCILFLY